MAGPTVGRQGLLQGRNDCGFVSHLRGCTGTGGDRLRNNGLRLLGRRYRCSQILHPPPPSLPQCFIPVACWRRSRRTAAPSLPPTSGDDRNAPPPSGLRRYRDSFLTRHSFCSCAMTSAPFGNCGGFHAICSNPVGDPLAAVNRDQFQSPISRDHISHESRPSLKRKWCSCELGSRLIIERASSKIMYLHSPAIIVT